MKSAFKIDHIVIKVDDLAAAMADYSALGFTVLPGGSHADSPTHNALIVFADGAYIEIIAWQTKPGANVSDRLRKWNQASPGLVDFALLPGDIEADIAGARARGLQVEDAQPGGRLRPDGQQIAWKTANLAGAGLPFFCADVTPRSLRVPEGAARQHPNGVTGVADITVVVADLATSTVQYQALLGLEPQARPNDDSLRAKLASFHLGQTTISLAQALTEHSPLYAYLTRGGERPFSFSLRTDQTRVPDQLDLRQTHGARIKLVSGDQLNKTG